MPRHSEPSVNVLLGETLGRLLPSFKIWAEDTSIFVDNPALQPDIIALGPGTSPVVIEAEYLPARNVESEANSRLDLTTTVAPRPVESVIALRYPSKIRVARDFRPALESADLSYCVFNRGSDSVERFPESGWLDGSAGDLADMVRLVSVPQRAVDEAAAALERGIDQASLTLNVTADLRPGITPAIARLLGMIDVPQTRRMACAIVANAMVFHERLAGSHDIKPLSMLCGPNVPNPKRSILAAWDDILKVNYWPIFAIARDIVEQLPSEDAAQILVALNSTAGEVSATGISNANDLTGRVFQRLIADRKYLATFYTLPPSAALLAQLAVKMIDDVEWSDPNAIKKLRVADFACGTGALLSAVYEQITLLHERAGGDPVTMHPVMMEEVLYGCDVMPSAIHITGSTLSGAQPTVEFGKSRLYTFPYGRQPDGSVSVGSMELLQSSAAPSLFNTSDPALRTGSIGEETAAYVVADIPDEGFDLVIMNPPFTSNTKHRDAEAGVLNAAFAAYDSTGDDQSDMATRLRKLAEGAVYHGHAGMASAFASLADRKLRPDGVMAMVLPFTAVTGRSWEQFRKLLATRYTAVTIVSIAASGNEMSFSSDTGIAECLVIAKKLGKSKTASDRGKFVSLRQRPASFAHSLELSKAITTEHSVRHLEDGPYNGIPVYCGDSIVGETLEAPIDRYGDGWAAARLLNASVAQVAHALANGELWLPAQSKGLRLPMAPLGLVGRRGLDSQLFVSAAHRGPFTKAPRDPNATYPAIWNHDAKNETRLMCSPDSQLMVRPGMEAKAAEVWTTASRSHFSRGFRFNSQPLAVAITGTKSAGGRAWPSVVFPDPRYDYAFSLWGNSTLGLVCYWWNSNRQVAGRGDMTISSVESLPLLDLRSLSDDQLLTAAKTFQEFSELELKPAYLADADPVRARLDRRVVCDLLGFNEDIYLAVRQLAATWCSEPSVHGGKSRPRGSALVIDT